MNGKVKRLVRRCPSCAHSMRINGRDSKWWFCREHKVACKMAKANPLMCCGGHDYAPNASITGGGTPYRECTGSAVPPKKPGDCSECGESSRYAIIDGVGVWSLECANCGNPLSEPNAELSFKKGAERNEL
jgi:hypothetical protein